MKEDGLGRLWLVAGSLFYMAALQWAYPRALVPAFEYAGMAYRDQSAVVLLIQYILGALPSLWLPRQICRPSHLQLWLLYLTIIVPSCLVPYHISQLPVLQIHLISLVLIGCFFLLWTCTNLPPLTLTTTPRSWLPLIGVVLALTVATYAWMIATKGFSSLFLEIDDVYTMRAELRSDPFHPILGYLYWWQGTVINPLIMAAGFAYRRPLLVLAGAFLQVELYSLTSLRTFLAGSAFTSGIGLFLLVFKHHRGSILLWSIAASVVLAVFWYFYDPHAVAALLLLDRWIFNGGQISGCYFEFFSTHEPAQLQHSSIGILRWLFPGPYDLPIGQVIGRAYFIEFADGEYTNATGHFWADGFASFGMIGMIVVTFAAGALLWVIDSFSARKSQLFLLTAFSMVGMSLAGQGVLTSILTGGIAPFILVLFLVPDDQRATLSDIPRGRLWPA